MNFFERLGAEQLTASAKRKHRDAERRAAKSVVTSEKDAPMIGNAMERERDERNAQMARYRRRKADERDELLHRCGREATELFAMLKGLSIDSASQLVTTVMAAQWIKEADVDTRHQLLGIIADAIMRLRIRNGLAPFDDAIGDEPLTAFQIIRAGLMGV